MPAPTQVKRIDYEDGDFLITCPFAYNAMVQSLPDRKFLKRRGIWVVPANWRSRAVLEALEGFEWTDEALGILRGLGKPTPSMDQDYPSDFPFKYTPFDHQDEAYRKAYNQDSFALFFEQGLGKTKTSIDLGQMWWSEGIIDTIIIISPVSIRQVWERELVEHLVVPYESQLLKTKGEPKWKNYTADGENIGARILRVLIVGIESFSQGGAYGIIESVLPSLGKCLLIVDESTRIKNHKTTRTQRVIELSKSCVKRLILTGTPVTQGIQDLYSQFEVLNPQTLALKSFFTFRNRYCQVEAVRGAPPGVTRVVGYKNIDELLELIEPWSLRREKEDCLDLPPKIFQTRTVPMAPQQKKAYMEMKKKQLTVIEGSIIETEMILETYLRLQQIAGGFYPDLENNPNTLPIPGKNPKLEEMMAVMDEIGDKQVIIWTRFRPEVAAISEALTKSGYAVSEFHGGLNEEEKKTSVDAFLGKATQVMVVTQQSGSYGHTWTVAHHAIYYSMGFSLEEFLQSQDRIHRIGQTVSCSYTLLGCAGTVDVSVIDILMNKKSLADYVSDKIKNNEDLFDG